jgi:hypothetical protein
MTREPILPPDPRDRDNMRIEQWRPPLGNGAADPFYLDSLGEPRKPLPPLTEAMRANLLVSSWLTLKLPPRDFLLGDIICTTSRWLIYGETGVGKTLFGLEMAAAIAAGKPFLKWQGRRPARVMYLDGELPAETFKERVELVAGRYGADLALYGYNREILGDGEMPPLNTPEGVAWLLREIDAIRPDAIFYDSIMCLLTGSMAEEESWAPMKQLVRQLTAKRIAQVFLHHTGHDTGHGFGTKTREWEMDTVLSLKQESKDDPSTMTMEFQKARLRTPATAAQFVSQTIMQGEREWSIGDATPAAGDKQNGQAILRRQYLRAYDDLADSVAKSPGFNRTLVRKVGVDAIQDRLKERGLLLTNDKGNVTGAGRKSLHDAKIALIVSNVLVEENGMIWRLYNAPDLAVRVTSRPLKGGEVT